MSSDTILAIDQGTSSTRALAFSPDGAILATTHRELDITCPHKGRVEQSADTIARDVNDVAREVLGRLDSTPAAIGISNQRETTILWDRATGKPVHPAIVWQDRRTADICQQMKSDDPELEQRLQAKTGLVLDPYFSATKVKWLFDNVEGLYERAEAGEIAFGTPDSYALWQLTGGRVHATDITNAGRTLLYNIVEQDWDEELLEIFGIPRALLPEVRDNVADFGTTDPEAIGAAIPVGGMAGDQQAALIGQACFRPGMVKSTYGTGCFALMNIGETFTPSSSGLLTTPAYRINGQMAYALEGAIFTAGAAIQWLRDNLGLIGRAEDSEALATSVMDNNGVYLVPAFTGLGAPHWRPDARAIITGLSRESASAHIARAALEAQAYQTHDLMGAFIADSGHDPAVIRGDGGLVTNDFACQFLSDILGKPVELPHSHETTARGAAFLAGLKAGIYADLDAISAQWYCDKRYTPQMDAQTRDTLLDGWAHALRQALS